MSGLLWSKKHKKWNRTPDESCVPATDTINPQHYKGAGGLEVIDVIEAFGLQGDYYIATAIKYILRAGKKPGARYSEDLEKAVWFLKRGKERGRARGFVPLSKTKQTEHLADGVEDSAESSLGRGS